MAAGRDAPRKAAARGVASVASVDTSSPALLLQNPRKNGRPKGESFRATACRPRETQLTALRGLTAVGPGDAQWRAR